VVPSSASAGCRPTHFQPTMDSAAAIAFTCDSHDHVRQKALHDADKVVEDSGEDTGSPHSVNSDRWNAVEIFPRSEIAGSEIGSVVTASSCLLLRRCSPYSVQRGNIPRVRQLIAKLRPVWTPPGHRAHRGHCSALIRVRVDAALAGRAVAWLWELLCSAPRSTQPQVQTPARPSCPK
jgi:hypothetical protein